MHTAELRFDYRSPKAAATVAESVDQEIGEIEDDRAGATLSREAAELRIDIEANDLIALRAAMNTWGTLIEVAERVVESSTGEPL